MPEAEDDVLQRICAEVEADFWFEPPTKDNIQAFAKAVALRYAATVGAGVPEEVRRAFEGVETGPLAYRPHDLDDWGTIRQARANEDGFFPFIAQVRASDSEQEKSAAREERRDPHSTGILGPAFVAAFNWALSVAAPAGEQGPSPKHEKPRHG